MTRNPWIDPESTLLGSNFPMPLDRPFTTAAALAEGLGERQLGSLLRAGHLRRLLHGVYAAAQAPDNVRFRAEALTLVVPDQAVVSGRTAAWLHGIPILERGSHLAVPPLHLSDTRDTRMRRIGVDANRRMLTAGDIELLQGVRVTSVLRTACDLGRLLWRFDAIAALDGALAVGLDKGRLLRHVERFRGYRGVRQLRALAPYADGLAESPGESALRLHWLDAGFPPPQVQYPVTGGEWPRYRLDMALSLIRYAAEYDGQEHHSSTEDRAHDERRRRWITEECHWTVDVFTKEDVYGRNPDIGWKLRDGARRAREAYRRWSP
jgi:hypothetical protein